MPRPSTALFSASHWSKLTFAAAEVQDAGVGLDELADDGVVAAAEDVADEGHG